MTLWITQCLCPQRHAMMATTGEADDIESARRIVETPLRDAIATMLRERRINPWCGLCHAMSDTWRYETARTRFATMAEAKPTLERMQDEQIAIGALVGELLGDRIKD